MNSKRYKLDMRRRGGVRMGVGETGEGKISGWHMERERGIEKLK